MVTKVSKIEIVKPLDTSWKVLGEVLRDLQYNTWKIANKGIQIMWDYQKFDFSYKQQFGEYFKKRNKTLPSGNKSIQTDIAALTTEWNYMMPGAMKPAIGKMLEDKWKADQKKILNGEKSIPSFKRNIPIELHNTLMMDSKRKPLIYTEKNGQYTNYNISIALLSKEYAKSQYERDNGRFLLALAIKDHSQVTILDRLISGEYKLSMSKISYNNRKKKWFFLLTYSFDPVKKELNPENVLGVDLGIKVPAMLAVNFNSYYQKTIGDSEEVYAFETQMEKRRKSLQRSRQWAGKGSRGHGRKTLMKPLEKLGSKQANFKDTKNHTWSKAIIDEAIKNECGVIQLENLEGISENNLFLKRWTYFDLQQKIIFKAREVGIEVRKINPKYTSARCHKCGHIHLSDIPKELWRPTQENFNCQFCGYKGNADVNAARNIAIRDIEQIIQAKFNTQVKGAG